MISIIRILIIILAVFAESRVLLRFKDKKLNSLQTILWSCVWLGLISFALFISNWNKIGELFGLTNVLDAVVALSIVVLFYLFYKQTVTNQKFESEITHLVREIALLKDDKKNKNKKK